MWKLKFVAYCGMTFPVATGTYREMQAQAVAYLKRHRTPGSDYETEVVSLSPKEWEVTEPEGCMLIPDWCGWLRIDKAA